MIPHQYKVVILAFLVTLAFLMRVFNLGTQGFNEDEVNKVEAVEGYRHGDFSLNREHPMLMKSLIALSVTTADAWNRNTPERYHLSEETAVRLPNVIFGSLTALVIFALAEEFFGLAVGMASAFVWAVLPLAIAVNRVAKEDTLLVFFSWVAYYAYLRAKKQPASTLWQRKLYLMSGSSFGLMLASKYFPHYLGLNFLYHHLLRYDGIGAIRPGGDKHQRLARRDYLLILGSCAVGFLLFNPAILAPTTWQYMWRYAHEQTVTHHGYLMMGHLYYNDPGHPGGAMPVYTYLLFLAIKTPLSLLVAMLVGLVTITRRWRDPGSLFLIFMLTIWLVPFSFLVAKWFRYMLPLLPVVSILCGIGIVKLGSWTLRCAERKVGRTCHPVLAAAIGIIFVLAPLVSVVKVAPYFSLYLNPLGRNRIAYYFPHDELSDIGLREAIERICKEAPEGSFVAGEAPAVFTHYMHRYGRDDLRFVSLSELSSEHHLNLRPAFIYVVVQEGRKYFENIAVIKRVESQHQADSTIEIRGASAAKLYRFERLAQLRLGP